MTERDRSWLRFALPGIVLVSLTGVATAQDASTAPAQSAPFAYGQPDTLDTPAAWRFTIGIPLWLPALDGDLTVDGFDFSADDDTGDALSGPGNRSLNSAFALRAEAQKDRFGVFGEGTYVDIGAERETVIGTTAEGNLNGFIGELGVLYTVYASERDDRRVEPFRLDVLGGLRVTSLDVSIDTEFAGSFQDSRVLWDPFIGARAEVGLLHWLSIKGRADVGGFDAFGADSSELAVNLSAAASFHLAAWCTVDAGYRWLNYDYEDGSGLDRFELDATLHGPYIELDFKF